MNIALAHHWLVGMRGGEKVLEQFSLLFPKAPIYTLVADPARLSAPLREHPLVTSLLQRVPGGLHHYKRLLPLFPWIVGHLAVRPGADFVLSSDAAVIKGLRIPAGVPHVCYCHSPPRYVWDMQETYIRQTSDIGVLGRAVFRAATPLVRRFDRAAAQRVDHFIANSRFVQERIRRCYGRESTVINPPVAVDDFEAEGSNDGYYLVVSELAPYKRIDLAIEAFNELRKPLIVIGHGSEMARLRRVGRDNITFLGSQPFAVLKRHYERCRALIFPGIEDFGITPLEAQAAGKPVIGFADGGLLETTVEGATAMLFREQTAASLAAAVREFEGRNGEFEPRVCRANALRFGPERFRREMKELLAQCYPGRFGDYPWTADEQGKVGG
jgi:glycosyltransferase involved in cell wall biosynthesis